MTSWATDPAGTLPAKAPESGWHWADWACEYLGTALLLLGGLSAVFTDFGPHSPVAPHLPSHSARLLLTGTVFAGTGSLVAISGLGRRSGAHLNPAVTIAFFTQRKIHPHDLAGYIVAQFAGAVTASLLLRVVWGSTARTLSQGITLPGGGLNAAQAALVEGAMTVALILTIFFMTSYRRTARYTPLATWILVAACVWQVAPYTGTSLNPVRSFAPALSAPHWSQLWVYFAGPVGGALLAAAIFAGFKQTDVLTAKLFHDSRYRSVLGTDLPSKAPAPSAASRYATASPSDASSP